MLRQKLSQDIIKMVNSGAPRDDVMIHLGMLLMLDTLQEFHGDTSECHNGGGTPIPTKRGDSQFQIRSITQVQVPSLFN